MAMKFCMLAFFIVATRSVSAAIIDPQFQSCEPRNCGNGHNITFPFYIPGQQSQYCGSRGFEVSCDRYSQPVIFLPSYNYTIEEIFYHNMSLRVRISGFGENGSSNFTCDGLRNASLDLSGTPFTRSSSVRYTNLTSQFSCSDEAWNSYKSDELACISKNGSFDKVIMMSPPFNNSGLAWDNCDNGAEIPVDIYGDVNGWSLEKAKKAMLGGVLLNWKAKNCSECRASGGRCGFEDDLFTFRCFCRDGPRHFNCFPGPKKRSMRLEIVALTVGIIFLIVLICCGVWMKFTATQKKRANRDRKLEAFFETHGTLAPKRYSYANIKKITNSFKEKLGQGGFGGVYKGTLKDGRPVAVKLLNQTKCDGEEFINEVGTISRTSHVNIAEFHIRSEPFCSKYQLRLLG